MEPRINESTSSADFAEVSSERNNAILRPEDHGSIPLAAEEPGETSLSVRTAEITNRTLEFLAHASNETLAACFVGLGASTYLVLGRIGLVLIGIVGGVVLHATWEDHGLPGEGDRSQVVELKRRREVGLDVVRRVLDWREKETINGIESGGGNIDNVTSPSGRQALDFSTFRPATGAALETFTNAVIRDYVKWWYSPLLPHDDSFPFSCRQTLVSFITVFSSHLARKRPADTFIDFLTNSSSIAVVFMNELSTALMAPGAYNFECADALHRYLEKSPDSHLANVLDVEQQKRKFKAIAEDILHSFLDASTYRCEPAKAFLREVLAGLVLDMTVQSCAKPEFINGWIIYLLEEGDTELIDAIDAGVSGITTNDAVKGSPAPVAATTGAGSVPVSESTKCQAKSVSEHKRTVSKAEDAMEEAMQEAKRLTELIAAQEAKRDDDAGVEKLYENSELIDTESSSATTPNGPTPSSSESDLAISSQSFDDHAAIRSLPKAETPVAPAFTSFDQILPPMQTTAVKENGLVPAIPPLTLHNASVSIFDDSHPGETSTMRSKPQADYLLQIEPATPQHPGWMIARKYPDFETLHEVLRRISVVSGVPAFAQKYSVLPGWKNRTKTALRSDLERYLRDALSFTRLAESEGMKRFLEKDHGPSESTSGANKAGFGFPSPAAFESMGKGMLDVLASAPKGAAGGGKAILGGFTGVVGGLGSIGHKKQASVSPNRPSHSPISTPGTNISRTGSYSSSVKEAAGIRQSQENDRDPYRPSSEFKSAPPLPNRPNNTSSQSIGKYAEDPDHGRSIGRPSLDGSPVDPFIDNSKIQADHPRLQLPPPPSEISDNYLTSRDSPRSTGSMPDPTEAKSPLASQPIPEPPPASQTTPKTDLPRPIAQPLNEAETRVAIELFFALINELYTLSSAWNIRRTLLNAAKSYLLRPGNPSLTSIQQLLQSSLDNNVTDEGIAGHLTKLRENSLPTEEESKSWPKPPNEDEKEQLRIKARRLLVSKGMPAALTSVMGAAASGEALGRVFDSLQVESVARGFMFAIILQGIRALAQ